jgi:hypothetical protein
VPGGTKSAIPAEFFLRNPKTGKNHLDEP